LHIACSGYSFVNQLQNLSQFDCSLASAQQLHNISIGGQILKSEFRLGKDVRDLGFLERFPNLKSLKITAKNSVDCSFLG